MSDTARMEIAVYPLGTGSPSISREVSSVFEVLDHCGCTYEITPMGTIIEGPVDRLFTLARDIHESVLAAGSGRAVTMIRIDDRRRDQA